MSQAFLRIAAWALVLGGIFIVINDGTHLGMEMMDEDTALAEVAASPAFLGHGGSHLVYGILVMLGLTGLAVRYGPQFGGFGLGVLVFAFVGQALMLALYATFTFGATISPETFLSDDGPPGALFNTFAPIALFSGMGGLSLVGIVLAVKKVLSRPAGIVLAIAAPAFIFVPVPAGIEAIVGIAVIWIGWLFVRDVSPVGQPTPQVASHTV